jgi:hypothetical protein
MTGMARGIRRVMSVRDGVTRAVPMSATEVARAAREEMNVAAATTAASSSVPGTRSPHGLAMRTRSDADIKISPETNDSDADRAAAGAIVIAAMIVGTAATGIATGTSAPAGLATGTASVALSCLA